MSHLKYLQTAGRIVCLFLLTLLTRSTASAQKNPFDEGLSPDGPEAEFLIGLTGGVMQDFHSGKGTEQQSLDEAGCPITTAWGASTNRGYTFGIVGQYRFNSWLGIRSALSFTSHIAVRNDSYGNGPVLVPNAEDPDGEPTILEQTVSIRGKWEYACTTVDLLADIRVIEVGPGGLRGQIGTSIGLGTELASKLVQRLEEPEDARFINPDGLPTEDDGRSLVLQDGIDPISSRIALRAGLAYDLPLFGPFHIQPGITFDYGLGSVREEAEWKMNSLVGQLDILMEL